VAGRRRLAHGDGGGGGGGRPVLVGDGEGGGVGAGGGVGVIGRRPAGRRPVPERPGVAQPGRHVRRARVRRRPEQGHRRPGGGGVRAAGVGRRGHVLDADGRGIVGEPAGRVLDPPDDAGRRRPVAQVAGGHRGRRGRAVGDLERAVPV